MTRAGSQRVMNRWMVVVAAMIVQISLGALYAWSVFTPYLVQEPFALTRTQTQIIFSTALATFGFATIPAGIWQRRVGPRTVSLVGGLLMGAAYLLAGVLGDRLFGYFANQVILLGVVAGVGVGMSYVCPIAVGMKWFPDKRGLITGLVVTGFGLGALLWIQLAGELGGLLARMGVLNVFIIYGITFAVTVGIGSIWLVNPPAGWKPAGWTPAATKARTGAYVRSGPGMDAPAMLRTPQFYGLWVIFIFAATAGLLVIGNIQLFGMEALQAQGFSRDRASAIGNIAMAVFYSLANGGGRPIWGALSDRIGRKATLMGMCIFQGLVMIGFYWMGGVPALLYLGAFFIGLNFGGALAIVPTVTADLFGVDHIGEIYGWVFTAFGVGGIVGPVMAAGLRDAVGNWQIGFVIAGAACFVAAAIASQLSPPPAQVPELVAEPV